MSSRASGHACINIVFSIAAPEALDIGKIECTITCLAVKFKVFIIARSGDKPHSISIQTGLNPDFGIMYCQ